MPDEQPAQSRTHGEHIASLELMDKLAGLCKRRGFVYPSSEIYSGLAGFWDYGPLGVEMKNNIKRAWWTSMVQERDDVVGIETSIIMNPRVWEASGHVATFTDPMVDCRNCKHRFRADHVLVRLVELENGAQFSVSAEAGDNAGVTMTSRAELQAKRIGSPIKEMFPVPGVEGLTPLDRVPCPQCESLGTLTDPRKFNLMFKTNVGPVDFEGELREQLEIFTQIGAEFESWRTNVLGLLDELEKSRVYLRPETAQAMFVNFENVVTSMRRKLPFGIAQIGRSFRNEITPGNFIFRLREFEQMEMEFFCKPGTDDEWHAHWIETRLEWFKRLGVRSEKLRVRPHDQEELSHYSKATSDIEYEYDSLGWSELEGIANRTDFDLKAHAAGSGKAISYFDEETKEHIVPYVIEPAVGVERTFLTFLFDAYDEEEVRGEKRVLLRQRGKLLVAG